MRFLLADRGSVLTTRDRGTVVLAELEARIAAELEGRHELVLDFTGVQEISHSFADEFVVNALARARRAGWPEVQLEHMNGAVAASVRRALRDHSLQLA